MPATAKESDSQTWLPDSFASTQQGIAITQVLIQPAVIYIQQCNTTGLEVFHADFVIPFAQCDVTVERGGSLDLPAIDDQLIVHEDAHTIIRCCIDAVSACLQPLGSGPPTAPVLVWQPWRWRIRAPIIGDWRVRRIGEDWRSSKLWVAPEGNLPGARRLRWRRLAWLRML